MISRNQNLKTMFIYLFIYLHFKFSCSNNITARNSENNCYKEPRLSKWSGALSTSQHFYAGKSYYGLFILTINCKNYNISVSSLKQLVGNIKQMLTGTVK